MSSFERFNSWLDAYREVAFDLLRIYLGVGLLVRGVLFFLQPEAYRALLGPAPPAWLASDAVLYAVAAIHLAGGGLMAAGVMTRTAALVQIPVLAGAVFLVHFPSGLFGPSQSLEFSALVLFLLVLVFLHGAGRWSVEHYRRRPSDPLDRLAGRLDLARHPAFELLRIYLGLGLVARGILFLADGNAFLDLLGSSTEARFASAAALHYVAFAHLAGGFLLAVGLLTRLAAMVQIPILIGAVFFVHLRAGLVASSQSLEFSVLVLVLLVLVFLYGPGVYSADHRLSVLRHVLPEPSAPHRLAHAVALEAPVRASAPLRAEQEPEPACPLGDACPVGGSADPRANPFVSPARKYGLFGALRFFSGITGPPEEIEFTCSRCGRVVGRSRDPEDLRYYRYR